ncbi:MAG TPA: hypothetical protein VHY56_02150, partial [Candidatus Binataceae bacterium]|nr:hypothetical protein [Candidatus Binataceae bacterium]
RAKEGARMSYDLLIKDVRIYDSWGGANLLWRYRRGRDRIVAVGGVNGTVRREIKAGGLVTDPGSIDIHTRYDAQISSDPFVVSAQCAVAQFPPSG